MDDPESRVRYYACESLYNIAKVPFETKPPRTIAPWRIAALTVAADPSIIYVTVPGIPVMSMDGSNLVPVITGYERAG